MRIPIERDDAGARGCELPGLTAGRRAQVGDQFIRLGRQEPCRYRGRGVPFADLVQDGTIGLLRASERFDHRRGLLFSTYAAWWIRRAILDAFARASVADVRALDGIETHDCFTISEYLAIDHFGLTPPGQSHRAIEDRSIERGGAIPINASGGLIGLGHPVGATGVRMLRDAARQVTGRADDMQIEGARRMGTLNIGGSGTTVVSFVVASGAIE